MNNSKKDELINSLIDEFRIVFRQIRREINELLGDEISSNEFIILNILCNSGHKRISDLADMLNVSISHVTALTDQMVKKNLVVRIRSEYDRRVVELSPTNPGKELVNALNEKKTEYMKKRFEKLTVEEIKVGLEIFRKLQ